jgi:glycosyltransferase involved in cell wall biosynthesis
LVNAARRLTGRALNLARRLRSALTGGGAARGSTSPLPAPYRLRQLHPTRAVRPRVLHVIANFPLGGSSRLVVDLIEGLGHAYEQTVASDDLPASPAYEGVVLQHHPARTVEAACERLRARRPDFVHVHYLAHHRDKYGEHAWAWYRPWFEAAERMGVRVIENITIPTEPYVSDSVACYVHVSDYVRQQFGRQNGRHVTIYPGSDLDRFAPPSGAQPADDCLGMVYRLARDKLDERAMEPFIEAIRIRPGTRALIVGGGVWLESYRERVAEAGMEDAFEFTGYVAYEALPALYRRMGVFVAPVHRESFGQDTSFAMGLQLPVVGYDVGAIPEIVADDSLLAPAGDSGRLGAIAAALLDDRDRRVAIGTANRARAERMFSVRAMVAAYEALYEELTTTRARADATDA